MRLLPRDALVRTAVDVETTLDTRGGLQYA